jgi:pimeloyl-ACP methyl ester carboxylesterase
VRQWVVLPGLAETAEEFDAVRRLLPPEYDVQVLDAWSTPVTAPVDRLRAGLGVTGPVGVIGHSIGGLAGLRWALREPADVAALLLVDTSLPSEDGRPWLHPGRPGDAMVRGVLGGLGKVGLTRLAGPPARDLLLRLGSLTGRDPLLRATVRSRYGATEAWPRFWNELTASWSLAAEVSRLLAGPHPVLPPVTQLIATGSVLPDRLSAGLTRRWLRDQRALSDRLGSRLEVLPDAGHLVHLDRPDAIATAVLDLATAPAL